MRKPLDEKKIQAISELGRKFSDTTLILHENIAMKAGLSGADHKYLSILMQNGAMTAGQLSLLTGLSTGAITGVVDRLEKKDLVKREFDKEDRRKIVIVPNYENAMQLLGNTFGILQDKMIELLSKYNDVETAIIEQYLNACINAMKEVVVAIKAP
jgi:DNA-binding MarR family transcriptional regulator